MGDEKHIDGRWLYSKLRLCGKFKIVARLYKDWIRTNSMFVGFLCEMKGDKTQQQFDGLYEYFEKNNLPLIIEDLPYHKTKFKIKVGGAISDQISTG